MATSLTSTGITFPDSTTQTTAASASSYVGIRSQVFTSSGTFTVPTGVTAVKVTVIGGGGSGGGFSSNGGTKYAGSAGGTSSFGAYCSATGGAGATNVTGGSGAGGSGSGGNFNYSGTKGDTRSVGDSNSGGGYAFYSPASSQGIRYSGFLGGLSGLGATTTNSASGSAATGYGCGGGGAFYKDTCGTLAMGSGGGGGISVEFITGLTPGGTVAVTVGSGGATSSGTYTGGAGFAGVVLVEW